MTTAFVQRNTRDFFNGKKAKLTVEYKNIGGEAVEAGTTVTIIGKHFTLKNHLNIKSDSGIQIYGIDPEHLELLKTP
ncbi:hypothetical protein Q765_00405 [Flavobacterium rivuli WB 3.3-2 = DSM 21788]|uniref:Uncharacterized protein n=1 Tax=Flavobacterium rivuli WB 3.3-2 = DSM 21788 TaxID=1121895 RepID=A0A0A2M9T7_9FLAO|nr:hypothetical protein [Flavobacterium rivuli]KGO88411.1 hypothetical protein Q765_00405 [Flavobacterium rivuli WB 3.3-2 = DSM 21788]